MEECFKLQRKNLTNLKVPISLEHVKSEWPYLLVRPFMDTHFRLITSSTLSRLSQNYLAYERQIIKYLEAVNNAETKKLIAKEYYGRLSVSSKAVALLTSFFKEDMGYLLKNYPIGTTMSQVIDTYIPEAFYEPPKKKAKKPKSLGPVICAVGE
jgi:hypothetical protein